MKPEKIVTRNNISSDLSKEQIFLLNISGSKIKIKKELILVWNGFEIFNSQKSEKIMIDSQDGVLILITRKILELNSNRLNQFI
jgi:hypothetical protein